MMGASGFKDDPKEDDPYALNDNMQDPEGVAFITQEAQQNNNYDLNYLTQMDGMAENSA